MGAACGIGQLAAATEGVDTNQDGEPDTWIEEARGAVVTLAVDRDFDGTIDSRTTFDSSGHRELEEFDFNFDGDMDDFYYYVDGVLERQEVDSNFDGAVDVWVYLVEGLYVGRYEQDTDYDGEADRSKVFGQHTDVAARDG